MAPTTKGRLQSLDTLRGFDMFFIMGGDAMFWALGALLPGTVFETWAGQMGHAVWDGFTFTDLIFSLFLFMAGVSFPFSVAKQRSAGKSDGEICRRIVRRGLTLVLLGVVYNGLLQFRFDELRYASVLGRIGLAWMFAALLSVFLNRRNLALCGVALLLGYWILLAAFPATPGGAYTMEGSLAGQIDRLLLPGRLHLGTHDPEGLLSTLPAVTTAILGILTGGYIRSARPGSGHRTALAMGIAAVAVLAVGWIWDGVMPVNKNLWTSSFVCVAGGLSVGLFALFYWVIDVLGRKRWTFFFRIIGVNSITIYLAQVFIDFNATSTAIFGGTIRLFPENMHYLLSSIGYIAVCWLFLYILYRNRIFLKV